MKCWQRERLGHVTNLSSIYTKTITGIEALRTNSEASKVDCVNPKDSRAWKSLSNQALGACFNP